MLALAGASHVDHRLFTYDEARTTNAPDEPLSILARWMATYPVNGHADLGRTGSVCPFVRQSTRLDLLRLAICPAGPDDEDEAFAIVRGSFRNLEGIPAPPGRERLRTIVIGFPNCANPEGLEMLGRVFKRHKYYTLVRFRMIAFFHAASDTHGLWNPEFRPMRSPMPVLGARYMIEQDAIFAAHYKLLLAPYLLRFGLAGVRRLAAYWRGVRNNPAVNT